MDPHEYLKLKHGEYAEHLYQWIVEIREKMASIEVDVPDAIRKHSSPHMVFPTECFPRACQFIKSAKISNSWYVLGEAWCGGCQQHGWGELGDVVFDGTTQRFYDRPAYYDMNDVRPWYKFDRGAVVKILRRNLESWRWDNELDLPWADPKNPQHYFASDIEAFFKNKKKRRSIKEIHLESWK